MAVGGVVTRVALVQQEVSLAFASVMEVVKGARWIIALRVLRVCLASAYPMEVAVAANTRTVQKVLKGARCSVKLTVVAEGACFWRAQKVQKGALHSVRATVEGKDVHRKDALRACTVELYFVLVMVGVKDVLWLDVPGVQGDVQITASVMGAEKGASLKDVQKVRKEALIFARHMVEGNDALGDSWVPSSAVKVLFHVTSSQGENLVSVLPTMHRCRKKRSIHRRRVLTHLHRRKAFVLLEPIFLILAPLTTMGQDQLVQ